MHGRLEFHESYAITTGGTNDLSITTRDGSTPWAGYGDSSQIIVESDTNAGIKLYTHGTGAVYISGSSAGDKLEVVGGIKATGNISDSSTSTGSFGRVEVSSGKVLGRSTSGVSTPFSVVGGTSTSAGGLQFGAYNGDFGGIWSGVVTPATFFFAFVAFVPP